MEPQVQLFNLAHSYWSQKEKLEAALPSLPKRYPHTSLPHPPLVRPLTLNDVNTSPSRGRERSESPDVLHQHHCIDKPTRPESTDKENHPDLGNLSPSADECKTLSLREGSHSLFPETWT